MLKGNPISMDPEWRPLIQSKLGLNTRSSYNNNASISITHSKDPLHMNPCDLFTSELEQHNKRSPLFLNPLAVPIENLRSVKPRGFIDAWSNAETNANKRSPVASNGKLSLSSLGLSTGGGVGEGMGAVHMALGQMDPSAATPGGPLAEVLRPSKVATTPNETASNSKPSSPLGTMASSPSGVLQKALASFSDSSSSSSPRFASSRASSEMALLCFNHTNFPSFS